MKIPNLLFLLSLISFVGFSTTASWAEEVADDAETTHTYEGTTDVSEGTRVITEGTESIKEGTAMVTEGVKLIDEGTATVSEGSQSTSAGTEILTSEFTGVVTDFDSETNTVTVVSGIYATPIQYSYDESTVFVDLDGRTVPEFQLEKDQMVLIHFQASDEGKNATRVALLPTDESE